MYYIDAYLMRKCSGHWPGPGLKRRSCVCQRRGPAVIFRFKGTLRNILCMLHQLEKPEGNERNQQSTRKEMFWPQVASKMVGVCWGQWCRVIETGKLVYGTMVLFAESLKQLGDHMWSQLTHAATLFSNQSELGSKVPWGLIIPV